MMFVTFSYRKTMTLQKGAFSCRGLVKSHISDVVDSSVAEHHGNRHFFVDFLRLSLTTLVFRFYFIFSFFLDARQQLAQQFVVVHVGD